MTENTDTDVDDTDTAPRSLYDYDDPALVPPGVAGDDDYCEPIPTHKLWVHPAVAATTDDLAGATDPSVECPCSNHVTLSELTYAKMLGHDGVIRCPACRRALVAHQTPPDTIGPNTAGGGSQP